MSDQEWLAYLETLSPELRQVAQTVLARWTTILEHERSRWLDDIQRLERRFDALKERAIGDDTP